jgi:hypothetical protein
MSVRVDPRDGRTVLILPTHVSLRRGLRFVAAKADWLAERRAALPARVPFADGADVPLLGVAHRLRHTPTARSGVWAADGIIWVSGQAEYLPRRVADWLKRKAAAEIGGRAQAMAEQVGKPIGRLRLGDPRSRWGSCTSRGGLSFSWRLVLAPAEVMQYVVAHEVAHLAEMNHSAGFWCLVGQLAGDIGPARSWLKRHGGSLFRYG